MKPQARNVFSLSPNPNFLYQTPTIKSILYQAGNTIERRQGLVALLADVGMGKSTIVRYLINDYDTRDDMEVIFIATPQFTGGFGLIKEISGYFKLPPKRSFSTQQDVLYKHLVKLYQGGKNVVLFVDEAQILKDDLLETIRGLLNFEYDDAKLVQVVLAGQIELKDRLNTARNKPLKSRIHSYALISPLTDVELREMIDFRCKLSDTPNPFSVQNVAKIWDVTKGVPRDVLKTADKIMDYKALDPDLEITDELIEDAAIDAGILEAPNE